MAWTGLESYLTTPVASSKKEEAVSSLSHSIPHSSPKRNEQEAFIIIGTAALTLSTQAQVAIP
jgi:hypothetical protein